MAVLRIQGFSGSVPVTGDRALPDAFAVQSLNTWLYGGELRGVRPPVDITTLASTTRKVFRIPQRTVGGNPEYPSATPPPSYLGDSVWKQFTDINTDIVKGQLIEDSFERYYFCSPTTGPMFNTYARLKIGLADYKLGVPGPNVTIAADGSNPDKPIIGTITGGVSTENLTRAYLYTWVNEFGEESQPSLPAIASGKSDATWPISNIKDPVAVADYPVYTKKYLYRTITGESGQTTYYRVNTIPLGTTTYSDNTAVMTDAVLANQLVLESLGWALPPANLAGFIAMPNGFLVGFDKPVAGAGGGNNIYMSEAYHWHAWPPEYKQAVETPVVGLGIFGQTCVVCTQGYPTAVTGSQPATCSFVKVTAGEPCLGRGSVVSTPQGVIYASQNGLILVSPAGIQNVTEKIITKDQWLHDYSPEHLRAERYQNGYLALRMFPTGSATPRSGFFLDPTSLNVALTDFTDFENVLALDADFWSGEMFLLRTGVILQRWDPPTHDMMPVLWRSKEFQYQLQENFGAYAIYWDDAQFSNVNYATSILPVDEHVRFRVLADRRLVYDEEVPRNGRPVRLPSGFKADIWQFEIKSRAPVYSLHVASTVKELRNV